MDEIDLNNLPRHVAIIMDGNGRWAQARGLSRLEGHMAGSERVRTITRACRRLGIEYLTLYAFSTENWGRPRIEVEGLMRILNRYLQSELEEMLQNDIRLNHIGDDSRLPKAVRKLLRETMKKTADNEGMVLTLALSYGGRADLIRAMKTAIEDVRAGRLDPESLDEAAVAARLSTAGLPDPDLMIRTSGEYRISNFLLWQLAYAELYITEAAWPDFDEAQLFAAISSYQRRQRRFGRTGEQVRAAEPPKR